MTAGPTWGFLHEASILMPSAGQSTSLKIRLRCSGGSLLSDDLSIALVVDLFLIWMGFLTGCWALTCSQAG